MKVFLSASVPMLDRDPQFLETVDVIGIREAIKALVLVLLERNGSLVFGGHPAITPLLRLLFQEAGVSPRDYITLYQSRYFLKEFPADNAAFERIVIVDAIPGDRERSLFEMRRRMLMDSNITSGVFIGGMEGVIEEFDLLREWRPDVAAFPVASTGAAALWLYKNRGIERRELLMELTYPTLFRTILAD